MMVEAVDTFVLATKPRALSIDRIPPRPPTPPRESAHDPSDKVPKDGRVLNSVDDEEIPPSSPPRDISPPSSSAESASGRPKKRVGWSPWTTYHKPESALSTPPSVRARPPSGVDAKSLRSILKPYSSPLRGSSPAPTSERPIAAHAHASFTSMLESVIKALASSERSKKLDTYISFSNTLKAYDEIPDIRSMQESLPALSGYLRRDLNAKMEDGGNPDSQLIQQAIKLMTIISWTPKLVDALDEANASFFFQHAIQKVEDVQTSKLSMNLYLHFLAQQKFPPRIVTAERCNRLVTALESLDQRVSGKAISKERVDVYLKLLSQNRNTMLARVNDWMDNAFAGLFSGIKEVRTRALICMAEVAKTMGAERSVSRTVTSIFNREVEGKKMFESIRQRLEHFIKEGEGIFVARMWAIVLLVVRAAGDRWEFFTPWLRVIETCFNVSDKDIKVEAQMAWSKLIYAMNIGPNSSRKLLELLCKPLEQYLDPKNAVSNTRKPRKAAMVNISVLLYYGFRPNAPPKQLSEIWEVVVVSLVERMVLVSKGEEVLDGCNILSSLFDGTTQKIWSEQRVLIGSTIKPEDIPRLDPKWVRSNCAIILKTVEVALRRGPWQNEPPAPGVRTLWLRFMQTLGDAGSKEIKISADLMETVAHLFNMFKRFWNESFAGFSSGGLVSPIQGFTFLLESALESLGPLCFTEKQLAYSEENEFIPASTPTRRYPSGSSDDTKYPPILHLFRLFMSPPQDLTLDEHYYASFKSVLSKCCSSLDSRRKKLQLLSSCEKLLPRRNPSQNDRALWSVLAELAVNSLPTPTREKALLSPSPTGGDLKDAVQILEWAFPYDVPACERLFNELITTVNNELGESYVSIVVIEPLADSLLYHKSGSLSPIIFARAKLLIEKSSPVKRRPHFQNNLKVQPSVFDRKPSNSEPFDRLYSLVDQLLHQAYTSDSMSWVSAIELLSSTVDLIARTPVGAMTPLRSMQQGVGIWIADPDHLVTSKNNISAIRVTNMWTKVLQVIKKLPKHDSNVLSHLCILIASGFESKRKGIVTASINIWNATFGRSKALSYPKRIQKVLGKLRPVADILLPSFPEDDDTSIYTPPEFVESQDTDGASDGWNSPTPKRSTAFADLRARSHTSSPSIVKETPYPTRVRRSTTPKLKATPPRPKHMDSQIQFAVIDEPTEAFSLDSQLLTEHQKDVKNQQAENTNMFPELSARKQTRKSKANSRNSSPEKELETPTRVVKTQGTINSEDRGKLDDESRCIVDPPATPSFISNLECEEPRCHTLTGSPTMGLFKNLNASRMIDEAGSKLSSARSSVKPEAMEVEDSQIASITISNESRGRTVDLHPDDHSVDENFVDAPEIHVLSDSEEMGRSKRTSEITVEVSPVKDRDNILNRLSYTSPEAQIMTEVRSANGTPTRKPKKGKKRKRASVSKEAAVPESPEVLDTIVISEPSFEPVVQPPSQEATDEERPPPAKKARAIKRSSDPNSRLPRKTRSSSKQDKKEKTIPSNGPLNTTLRKRPSTRLSENHNDKDFPASPSPNGQNTILQQTGSFEVNRETRAAGCGPLGQPDNTTGYQLDVSFVEETQLTNRASVSDSQPADSSIERPNPVQGGTTGHGISNGADTIDELQTPSPKHTLRSVVASGSSVKRPSRSLFRARPKSPSQQVAIVGLDEDQTNSTNKEEYETAQGGGEVENHEASGGNAIEALRAALNLVDSTMLSSQECIMMENEIFDAFTKIRHRRQSGVRIRDNRL